jgi:hypothetical protein
MVEKMFSILADLRNKSVTILLIEQNAKQALKDSGFRVGARAGSWRLEGPAALLADRCIAQLFLGVRPRSGGRRHAHMACRWPCRPRSSTSARALPTPGGPVVSTGNRSAAGRTQALVAVRPIWR